MSKEIYISSTPQETRLAIVEKDELTEIYYERENEYTLAGSIYNGKVTRVLPGMQSSFVDVGLERDAFLYITDFMEEQSDTADFDSGEASSVRRPGRDRGRRREEEPSPAGPDADSLRSEDEPRERPERNGSRARREGSRPDGRAEAGASAPTRVGEESVEPGAHEDEGRGFAEAEGASPETQSGAPGADSSRRWRGRRGRRRGRGPVEGNEPGSAAPAGASERDFAQPVGEDEGEPRFFEAAAAEPSGFPEASERVEPRPDRVQAGERGGGRDRRREDRGGRRQDRDGQRDDRSRERPGSREARPAQQGRDNGDPIDLSAGAEPLILPGESLSKYRRDGEPSVDGGLPAPTRTQVPSVIAKPSTQIELAGVWDGGPTLPGETLSRHREAAAPRAQAGPVVSEAQPRPGRDETDRALEATGRHRRRERDLRRGRSADAEPDRFSGSVVGSAPAQTGTQAGAQTGSGAAELVPADVFRNDDESSRPEPGLEDITVAAFEELEAVEAEQTPNSRGPAEPAETRASTPEPVAYEPQTELAPPSEAMPAELLEAVEQFHETVAEFEPGEDASASYRVDPSGPSEFRQSAPDADTLVDVRFDEDDPIAQEGAHRAFGAESGAGSPVEFTAEFTAVQPSGEMISDWPLTPEAEATASEAAAEAAPIEHESAVQSVVLKDAEAPVEAPAEALVAPSREFDPGDGQLEEELLDEEDGDLAQVQASFADDEMEEETLEGAADLGSMIREMSIDEITSVETSGSEDGFDSEEDDFEEDDLEEDDLEEDDLEEEESDADDSEADERVTAYPAQDEIEAEEGDVSDAELTTRSRSGASRAGASRSGASRAGAFRSGAFRSGASLSGDQEAGADPGEEFGEEPASAGQAPGQAPGSGAPQRERRDGRRGGRDRGGRESGARRDRNGSAGGRSSGHGGGRMTRHQAQTSDLPAISDLLKPGQEVLVQIAKEPIAKKGARITSHIALPGRFLVFMPTVQHVGVSRKIESDAERRRLKEILISERGEASGGFIVRTAASGASEEELRSDLRFLLNLWADIKQRSESSKSPALIYHDLNLVERILRDQVTDNFSAIWVDTETEYERVLRFLQRFQPSLIRRVKLYTKDTPLFEQFGITEEINKALRSKVWLKSGGSIVINQTEALVAIDINTGKYVGKTARLEDTIVKTNLDSIPEIVRQIRLRDLGGIIVIDFIDMDERRNRAKVLLALEEELKKDRAPSKVLQFNDFGLVAITRKRVKQSLERTLSQTCNTCAGTGMVKSPTTVCNEIFTEFRKMHKHLDKGDVMLRVNPEVVKQLKAGGGKWLQEMEEVAGKTILVKSDPSLHPEQFDIQ